VKEVALTKSYFPFVGHDRAAVVSTTSSADAPENRRRVVMNKRAVLTQVDNLAIGRIVAVKKIRKSGSLKLAKKREPFWRNSCFMR